MTEEEIKNAITDYLEKRERAEKLKQLERRLRHLEELRTDRYSRAMYSAMKDPETEGV